MNDLCSNLQKERYAYMPKLPENIAADFQDILAEYGEPTEAIADQGELKKIFPHTYGKPVARFLRRKGKGSIKSGVLNVGVILSGGQAPGGHNVIAGLFDGLKKIHSESKLIGFLGGPSGILKNNFTGITEEFLAPYRNTGGFDIIASGRTKLETEEQFAECARVLESHSINALVVIGGDDSNTNAALLAEYLLREKHAIQVIGVPKTIDGDLKNREVEISFGFDTACKVYSELIGNIARDANSARKYWHFIKLMGRSASHIALECALQTQPNICLIGEEVESRCLTLRDITDQLCDVICKRSEAGANFGIALIPEGLVEFIPEMRALIAEINEILAENAKYFATLSGFDEQSEFINPRLSRDASWTFSSLPWSIQRQLLMDRDPHGNVQVSRIETERLLIDLAENRLQELAVKGKFNGAFTPQNHFFGYEGRCAAPSNFDADYCYALGITAVLLISSGLTGYMANVRNLHKGTSGMMAGGIPLTMMMNIEQRHGKKKPVIKKALVDLDDKPFKTFKAKREEWASATMYRHPGPIQYFGPASLTEASTITLQLEQE
ncbi:MAG: diphosphate--fructose-6-phosphate 1-phosphotransferase [Spirochaetota bacterium]|jgi:pyrophosphate--fructose-6-phosphate 1-phosphotransferase|nr:diphosphate--fructose-6-phosphate 1-phosphotransferase [Spirochaetota bacterium]